MGYSKRVVLITRNHNVTLQGRLIIATAGESGVPAVEGVRDPVLMNPQCHTGAVYKNGVFYLSCPGNFDGAVNSTERENGIIRRASITEAGVLTWGAWQSVDRGEFGYSKIEFLQDGTLGIVYEVWESGGLNWKLYSLTPTVTRPAIRSYNFANAGSELDDVGSDNINCTNTGVVFASGKGTWNGTTAKLDLGVAGELAWVGRDVWVGVRFEFDGVAVNNTGARQVILGQANTGVDAVLQIMLDTNSAGAAFSQGVISVRWRIDGTTVQSVFTAPAQYAAGVPFNLAIELRQADNSVQIYKDGVLLSTTVSTAAVAEMVTALQGPFGFPLWLGAHNNRGVIQFPFSGSMTGFRYYGQSTFLTLVNQRSIYNLAPDTERIPSLVIRGSRIMIAFERRIGGFLDDTPSDIRLAVSTDRGVNWAISIIDASTTDNKIHQDSSMVYDITGRLHLYYITRIEAATVAAIYAGTHVGKWRHKYSDDDGDTWSAEEDLTIKMPLDPTWTRVGFGSDGALLLPSGRIIVYAWHVTTAGSSAADGVQFCFYTDDNGLTYTRSADWGYSGTNEINPVLLIDDMETPKAPNCLMMMGVG